MKKSTNYAYAEKLYENISERQKSKYKKATTMLKVDIMIAIVDLLAI